MLKTISLYTGIGGLDFGFEAAGFRTVVALEIDPVCCRTIRLNRDWPLLKSDIHDTESKAILSHAGLEVGETDVLIGGPPCQPFSKSSYWVNGDASRLDDPRADTLTAYLRVLRDTQPKAFLLENVYGLAYKGKDEGLQAIIKGIDEVNHRAGTNYTVSWKMLNAADYGVPQARERVFLIGSRNGVRFEFPSPTHGPSDEASLFQAVLEPYRTAWDAIGDLPADPCDEPPGVGGKWGDLLATIPEGQNYLWHTPRGGGEPLFGWRTRYWSFLLKLSKKHPSWTIQAQPGSAIGPFHWRNRKLSVKEMCRLQTFPDGLVFDCGRTDAQRMLGNAVPSLVAEILGLEIRRQYFDSPSRRRTLKLLPPVRKPVPKPEPLLPLPRKYRQYIGSHPDHPGEGKGRRAKRRSSKGAAVKSA